MIQLFRKVLCPIDFSEHSLAALAIALKVAQQNDAKIYLLNVAPVPAGAVGFQPIPMDPYPYLEKDCREHLEKLARDWIPANMRQETICYKRRSCRASARYRAGSRRRPDRDGHAWPQGIESPGPGQRSRTGRARITDAGSDGAFKVATSEKPL